MAQAPRSLGDGRYELVRQIGRGGSGQVWLARDHRLERDVAIKRIPVPPHLPDEERDLVRERIRREARAAARIDHPGVAPLFDIVADDDAIDLVMTYVEAPDLGALVRRSGPLDDAAAAVLGLQVLEVLEAAHAQGVVHRDVKPSNVLVGDDSVVLTDFGIAALADETAMTRTGTALGSPGYVAPEQAEGRDAAPEADLWGLGTLLYHAISGRPPFDRGRPIATMHAVVHDAPDPLDGNHPLAPLVDRLLAKDPSVRPRVPEIRRELERVAGSRDGDEDATTRLVAAAPTRPMGDGHRPEQDPTAHLDDGPAPATGAAPPDARPDVTRTGPTAPRRSSDDGRRGLGALIVAAAVLAVVGGLAWALLAPGAPDGDGGGEIAAPGATTGPTAEDTAPGRPSPTPTSSPDPSPSASPSPSPSPTPSPTATDAEAAVPEGWETYEGATYTVAHPEGWSVREDTGNRIDLVDPDTGAYLRMDWTDDPKPDPEADWERQSDAFAESHEGYEEIRIEPVDYRDYDAAMWEYEYSEAGGRFHAYNLGFVAGGRGYALNYQTPASAWDEMRDLFEGFRSSFQPHG